MTQTLTTERLREIASSPSFSANPLSHEVKYMARELLASREAQPVGWRYRYRRGPHKGKWIYVDKKSECTTRPFHEMQELFTAPPAPAVPPEKKLPELMMASYHEAIGWNACRAAMLAQPVSQRYRFPPHAYRELVNSLRDTAVKFSGTDQLRERLNTALRQFIEPDHPHTRTTAPEVSSD